MEKIALLIFGSLIMAGATARPSAPADSLKSWKTGGITSFNFTQVSLTNWAAGGKSSASGTVLLTTFANYKKDNVIWQNSVDLGYGIMKEEGDKIEKTDDKIELNSKYGYRAVKNLYYSVLFNFRSQFSSGYDYPDRENAISRFMAPGYLTLALGANYQFSDSFSLFFSPLTGKLTLVLDDELSSQGAFGVDPGKRSREEIGAYLMTGFKKEILKNVMLDTKANFFSNYLDSPQNIDVNWDFMLNMKINNYLSTTISTSLIYDDDTKIAVDKNNDGVIDEYGPRIQFKELFALGVNLKF